MYVTGFPHIPYAFSFFIANFPAPFHFFSHKSYSPNMLPSQSTISDFSPCDVMYRELPNYVWKNIEEAGI